MPIENMHFVPEHGLQIEETIEAGDKVGVFHLYRYWWAWLVLQKMPSVNLVWDMACGSGYGSRILTEKSDRMIVGFDGDPKALAKARAEYGHINNLTFEDLILDNKWEGTEILRGPPELIVCFETIEFLRHREMFLMQVVRNLAPGGVFLFSTPCSHEHTDTKPIWKFQQILYGRKDIFDLLCFFFEDVVGADVGMTDMAVGFPVPEYRDQINKLTKEYTVGDNLFYCKKPRRL